MKGKQQDNSQARTPAAREKQVSVTVITMNWTGTWTPEDIEFMRRTGAEPRDCR